MPENEWIQGKRFYFLGIGGASMSALGKYVLECGGELYGYDAVRSEKTAELEKAGAKIYSSVAVKEEEKALINSSEKIVCTSAISKENARFEECVAQGARRRFSDRRHKSARSSLPNNISEMFA